MIEDTNITIPCSLSRHVHSLVQSEFSTECDLIRPLNFQYHLFCLRLFSSCVHLLPCLPITFIPRPILRSILCFIRQFLLKIWPIQLASLLCIVCRIFLSSFTLYNTLISHTIGPADLLHPSSAPRFKTFQAFLIYFMKCPSFSKIQSSAVLHMICKRRRRMLHFKCNNMICLGLIKEP